MKIQGGNGDKYGSSAGHGFGDGSGDGSGNGKGYGFHSGGGNGYGTGTGNSSLCSLLRIASREHTGCPAQYVIYALSLSWAIANAELNVRY
jgi:hypothetical protein